MIVPSMRLNNILPMGSFSHRLQIRSNFMPVASVEGLSAVEMLNSDLVQVSESPSRSKSAFVRQVMKNGNRYRHKNSRLVKLGQCLTHCEAVANRGDRKTIQYGYSLRQLLSDWISLLLYSSQSIMFKRPVASMLSCTVARLCRVVDPGSGVARTDAALTESAVVGPPQAAFWQVSPGV